MIPGDEAQKQKWEEVANDPWTLRLRVPGGWIYCVVELSEGGSTNAIAFVPGYQGQEP